MRVSPQHLKQIRQIIHQILDENVSIIVFGSRLDDDAKGGDLDLLVQSGQPIQQPAMLSARIAGKISHVLQGRKVDVLLQAPNLKLLPIHHIAQQQGQRI